ncbi:MAG: gliding motility-associated C-terminal domain-containing protein [Bacteroidota bacterium]
MKMININLKIVTKIMKMFLVIILFFMFPTLKVFSQISPVISFTENPYNHNMHITSDGTYFYTINGGNAASGQVNKFSLTGTLIQTYLIGIDGRGLSYNPADGFLYVSTYLGDIVKITNLAAGTFTTLFTTSMQNDQASFALSPDGTKYYDFYLGTLRIHSLATGAVISTLTGLNYGAGGASMGDAAVAVDANNLIYTWNAGTQTVYVYNQSGVLTQTIVLNSGNYGFSLSITNCYLFVSVDGSYSTGTWYGYNLSCCPTATINYLGSPFCATTSTPQSDTLTGTGTYTGGTYSASPVGLSINSTTGDITPSLSTIGTYIVSYTIAAAGSCPIVVATDTITINALPTVTVPSNISVCNAGSVSATTFVSIPSVGTFAWTNSNTAIGLPANGTSNVPTFTATNTSTVPITSTITVTPSINGCIGTPSTYTITVNPTPALTAIATPATICVGATSSLSVTSNVAGTAFAWMPGALVGTPVTVTPTLNTTYTVTGTASGCTGSTTVSITVNPIPIVTASASPTSICSGQTATLTANGATTFLWMPGNLTGSPINVTPTSTTIYTVTGTTSGCTATATTTVTLNPAMVITPSASPASICNGATASLTASSSAAGTTFVWLPGGLSGSPISVTPASTTTYTVNGVSAAGCTGSASIVLTVNQNITVTATASPATICNGSASTLSASSSIPGTSFVWLPGSLSGSNINVTPNMTSNYIVEGTSPDGCSGSAAVVVTCYNAATVGIYGLPYNGCSPLDVTFNFAPVNLVANSTWHWDFDDLYSSNNTSSDSTGHHVYQHHGNFNVLFSAQDTNGCAISATTTIEVYVVPQADFEYDPQIGIAEILPITFDDISIDANYWLWDFGDPNSYNDNNSDLENPVHMYADSGMYTVQLIVTTDHNCSDTTSQLITINPGILFYVPNAFTPNGDDKNEVFKPIITGIDKSTYQLFIFDRWGKQAFYSNNLDIAWDGKYNGKDVPEGVFSYIIQFNEYSGKRHKYKGAVTLFR